MLRTLLIVIVLLASLPLSQAATGFRQMTLNDAGERPLRLALWYPTRSTAPLHTVGENGVFYGTEVIEQAPADAGVHPLVLLSHGYGGSWRNLSWLAAALAERGYMVAAPDHPGTTTADRSPVEAARLWLRPHDLTRVLDTLLAKPTLAGRVDQARIAAIGHSLGGWTVMALAGARFSPAALRADCQRPVSRTVCSLIPELGLNTPEAEKQFATPLGDPRVRAIVSLDGGLTRGFTAAALKQVSVPVLIVAAGHNIADLPAREESGRLAALLPAASTRYQLLPDASHFSFMQRCKAGAEARLEHAEPGEGIICQDGGQRSREAIHQAVEQSVAAFLAQALGGTPVLR